MEASGTQGTPLFLHPPDDGVQHSEVFTTRDTLDAIKPRWLAWLLRKDNYAEKLRSLPEDATAHPSVTTRFDLKGVIHPDGFMQFIVRGSFGLQHCRFFDARGGELGHAVMRSREV
jgi:hypothetical protein